METLFLRFNPRLFTQGAWAASLKLRRGNTCSKYMPEAYCHVPRKLEIYNTAFEQRRKNMTDQNKPSDTQTKSPSVNTDKK
jgi:hypothetical protein